ncbi:MAG: WD40 repeat domain-containing protein, partial [Acidobacteria bacterium]|nr:WD40 repeat domain-containing protein [Acidobacteriota bacterium]
MYQRFLTLLLCCLVCVPGSASLRAQQPTESLPGLLWKKRLEPALRSEVEYLHFSPDGKYLLAQDLDGITVLSREPFAVLFQIAATDIFNAQFTPDSQQVIFYNAEMRIQTWSISERKQVSAQQLSAAKSCEQTKLSPDGKTLACLESSGDLVLYDIATSAQLFRKDSFYSAVANIRQVIVNIGSLRKLDTDDLRMSFIDMEFSPDGRYFVSSSLGAQEDNLLERSPTVTGAAQSNYPDGRTASPENSIVGADARLESRYKLDSFRTTNNTLAFDLTTRKPVSPGGQLKNLLLGRFTFIGPDRIFAVSPAKDQPAAIATFPAGEIVKPLPQLGGKP